MFRTFVGCSQSQLQLSEPERHRVKSLAMLCENSRWLFVVTFYENQTHESVSEYISPGILELHGFDRKHPIHTAVMRSEGKISMHWSSRPDLKTTVESSTLDASKLLAWRIKVAAHQDAQRQREKIARSFVKIKREPTDDMHEAMKEAIHTAKAARKERSEAETGELIKAVQMFKNEDFRSLNSKYEQERLKREELEEENARLKLQLALAKGAHKQVTEGCIIIEKEDKPFTYKMGTYVDGVFHEIFSRKYASRDCLADFIEAQKNAVGSADGAAGGNAADTH
jgi:hypothetical protein